MSKKLTVGVIGCGNIAQMHVSAIQACKNVELVGVVDSNPRALQETARQFGIAQAFTDPREFFEQQQPDVVHILTPPQSHLNLARQALEAGCHVFVEKPFTMNAAEASQLAELAQVADRQLCVGHSLVFNDVVRRARTLVDEGAIGRLCGIDSYYGFDLDPKYFSAQGNRHWAHHLPGGLLMNLIDHPLSLVIPFMGEPEKISAQAVDVQEVIPFKIPAELRVLISDGHALAHVTVSLAASPRSHRLTLTGTEGTLQLDLVNQRLLRQAHIPGLPKAISRAIMNVKEALSICLGTLVSTFKVFTGSFNPVDGLPVLIERFYRSIETGKPAPWPAEYGVRAMRIMEETWLQVGCDQPRGAVGPSDFPVPERRSDTRALVTGATGFVGRELVRALIEEGQHDVRVFVRNPIKAFAHYRDLPVEVVIGELTNPSQVMEATEGVDVVYHLAAATGGSRAQYQEGTVTSTAHMVEAALAHAVKKFIYVSSVAVYDTSNGYGQSMDEATPYARRGVTDYTWSKIEAEKVILDAVATRRLPAVILRPGNIYGDGALGQTARIGYRVGTMYCIIGLNNIALPLVRVGNVVNALMLAANSNNSVGQTYNVVDDQRITQIDYIKHVSSSARCRYRYVFFPYAVAADLGTLARWGGRFHPVLKRVGGLLSEQHLLTCVKSFSYDNGKIKRELGWKA